MVHMEDNVPETGMALQNVAACFSDQHTIQGNHMESHLNQYILKIKENKLVEILHGQCLLYWTPAGLQMLTTMPS